ncbi:MAG: AraC family transcriptional regulator [Nannocystis sp.]|nr:AraC family transcriptional regulator [Nannocystis sp.]MBA3545035.1 AraC family transcriptional regulator [Nannocystis sp.]
MSRIDLHAAYYGGRGFTLYHAWGPHGARPLTPHFHDEYLICAQLQGHEECQVAGKLHTFSAGDLVLINPQQVHTGNARGSSDLDYITLYVDRAVVNGLADGIDAPQRSPEFTLVRAAGRRELAAQLRQLLELVGRARSQGTGPQGLALPDPVQELDIEVALQGVVARAFAEFSNLREPLLRSTNRVAHRKIARVLEHIRAQGEAANPTALSLDELAAIADLSKFHFLRQFAQAVGMTPGAYLRTLRLCQAARRLRQTRASILEIALGVGFADHPSFSRAFARHMGMTPSQYQALGPL